MQSKKKSVDPPVRVDRDGFVRCRVCGCTEFEPCNPPCSWVPSGDNPVRRGKNISIPMEDLCSTCHATVCEIRGWLMDARRPSIAALLREVKRKHATQGNYVSRAV